MPIIQDMDVDIDMEDGLTLTMCLEAGMLNHIDKVEAISTSVQKQHELKVALQTMKNEWKSVAFGTLPYKNTGAFLLKGKLQVLWVVLLSCAGADDVQALLDYLVARFLGLQLANPSGAFAELEVLLPLVWQGAFAVVIAGEYQGARVAMKLAKVPGTGALCQELLSFGSYALVISAPKEKAMVGLAHPNLCKILAEIPNDDGLIMDVVLFLAARHALTVFMDVLGHAVNQESGNLEAAILHARGNEYAVPDLGHRWLAQVWDGLQFLHAIPYLHRDLKPANILLSEVAKIADFGCAFFGARAEGGGRPIGSPGFDPASASQHHVNLVLKVQTALQKACPEVLRGEAHGPEADLFSFGAVMWTLLSGGNDGEERPQPVIYDWMAPPIFSNARRCLEVAEEAVVQGLTHSVPGHRAGHELTKRACVFENIVDQSRRNLQQTVTPSVLVWSFATSWSHPLTGAGCQCLQGVEGVPNSSEELDVDSSDESSQEP
ncbi:V-MOS [Symbiodinium sp. CCMP2592]|nr:V-MOS [Symbiodinium sp. CCMP2592]